MNLHTIELFSSGFSPLKPEDKVGMAIDLMNRYVLRCYPVTNKEQLLGYVWHSDLKDSEDDTPIEEFIRKEIIPFLKGDENIYNLVEILVRNKMDCIAVVDQETGKCQSLIRAWDVLEVLSKSATFNQEGSCVVLEMNAQQYSLSHITQICEHEDMQVIGVLVDTVDEKSNMIQVHLKVNGNNLERLVSAMKRYDFDVPYYSQSEMEPGVIKQRYDSLMKFLDI